MEKDYESKNAYETAISTLEFAKRATAMDDVNSELIDLVHTLYNDVSMMTNKLLDVVNKHYECSMDFYEVENYLSCSCNAMMDVAEQMLHEVYFNDSYFGFDSKITSILVNLSELIMHELNSVYKCKSLASCKEVSRQARAAVTVLTLKVVSFKLKIENYGTYM